MTRYVCVSCRGEYCPWCGGRGWLLEKLVHLQRKNSLIEMIAKNLVEKRITDVGPEEWERKAGAENLTVDHLREVETWAATGPIKGQFIGLTKEVIDALADLACIEMPLVVDQPELKVIG